MRVGSAVVAKVRTMVCNIGERGVVVWQEDLEGPLYGVIFERGDYDGFSVEEVASMLIESGDVIAEVADYHFTNVIRLDRDFHAGRFQSAFIPASHAVE